MSASAGAQGLAPGVQYDPGVPTLKAVIGHAPGEAITTPEQIGRYLDALTKAAPDRTRLVEYAKTWEGRPLHYFVIGSRERMARLDEIKRGLQILASGAADADRLVNELPAVVWLIHGVHGNEISSSDAALAEAYHLLAARGNPDVDITLRDALVIIDPMQNPDGRNRFITNNLLGRAIEPDPNPQSAEHDEPWPGGRSNHYLFDMNRDYFAMTQPETQGRARVMLEWYPQVNVDLHEMGGNSSYYFAPPANPLNPFITEAQKKSFELFGRANAAEFDKRGFGYFVRETYDSFYPGYGESWPIFHGSIGMTYEQASPRGLAFRREDGALLTYKDAVTHHFTAAITTAATAAKNRQQLLRDFLEYRRSATALGQKGTREYLIPPGKDPARVQRLARVLAAQGISVKESEEAFQFGSQQMPKGTVIVPLAQPAGRLARNLLDPEVKMDDAFIKEQDRRRKVRLGDQIYDVTAWSLPLMYDVEVIASDKASSVRARDVRPDATVAGQPEGGHQPPYSRRRRGRSGSSCPGAPVLRRLRRKRRVTGYGLSPPTSHSPTRDASTQSVRHSSVCRNNPREQRGAFSRLPSATMRSSYRSPAHGRKKGFRSAAGRPRSSKRRECFSPGTRLPRVSRRDGRGTRSSSGSVSASRRCAPRRCRTST